MEYLTNTSVESVPAITKDTFKGEIQIAFDILTHNWLRLSRVPKLTEEILIAICPMISLMPLEDGEKTSKLTVLLLNLCKRHNNSSVRLAAMK